VGPFYALNTAYILLISFGSFRFEGLSIDYKSQIAHSGLMPLVIRDVMTFRELHN